MRRGGDVALAFALGLALAASVVPGGAGCGGGGSGNGSSPGSDASTPPGDGGGVSDGQGTSADGPGGGGSDGSAPANDGPGSSGDSASAFDVGPITGLNGATYFVDDAKGSDANPGTATAPWKTLQKAGDTVKGGDTVTVRAGTYDGAIFGWDGPAPCGDTDCTITGTAAHPILLQADPAAAAGKVVIASKNKRTAIGLSFVGCDYVFVRGFTVTNGGTAATPAGSITKAGIAVAKSTGNRLDANLVDGVAGIGGILVDFGTNVLVTGNEVRNVQGTNTTGHGMYVSGGSTGVQVLDNAIHDNGYVGLHVNGDASEGAPGVVTNLLVAGNRIYENGQNGINADGLQGSRIENNVLYANARNGIELYRIDASGGSTGNVIVNDSIDQSMVASGYAIALDAASTGNVAFDDVLLGGAGPTSVASAANLATSTNLTDATGVFVDPAKGDYTLAPGGPGQGTGVGTFAGKSAPGAPGGGFDIGAFAFVP